MTKLNVDEKLVATSPILAAGAPGHLILGALDVLVKAVKGLKHDDFREDTGARTRRRLIRGGYASQDAKTGRWRITDVGRACQRSPRLK